MDALDRWLKTHAPDLRRSFADPIREDALREAEQRIGRSLPPDYVAFLRRHDGQRLVQDSGDGAGSLAPIFQAFTLLSMSYAEAEWEAMRSWDANALPIESVGPVRPLHIHDAWFPITVVLGTSQHHCLDLDPAPEGSVGQVIVVSRDDGLRRVVAPSFGAFVERLGTSLDRSVVGVTEAGIELADDVLGWLLGC